MKAVLLIGGTGKHAQPKALKRHKSLTVLAGKTLIEWQIEWLKRHNITSLILLAGSSGGEVAEYLGTGRKYGINVTFVFEEEPLGTAGAIRNAYELLKSEEMFIAMNGDVITDIDLYKMRLGRDEVAVMATVPLKTTYGVVIVRGSKVAQFYDRPVLENYWLNAGVYLMSQRIFSYLPETGNLEKTAFPKLAREDKLGAYPVGNALWYSIETERDLTEAEKEMLKRGMKP
jgi:NDP-sugar pyrophosphorylase family protein